MGKMTEPQTAPRSQAACVPAATLSLRGTGASAADARPRSLQGRVGGSPPSA